METVFIITLIVAIIIGIAIYRVVYFNNNGSSNLPKGNGGGGTSDTPTRNKEPKK